MSRISIPSLNRVTRRLRIGPQRRQLVGWAAAWLATAVVAAVVALLWLCLSGRWAPQEEPAASAVTSSRKNNSL